MITSRLQPLLSEGTVASLFPLEEINSTNTFLKERITGTALPALAITDNQTAGKGRMGRVWTCPAGENIAMSYMFCPSKEMKNLSCLTLLAGVAITQAVRSEFNLEPMIKWPNDIILGTRKICGILTEMVSDGSNNYVIIGIGINVNTRDFPKELADKATSLFLESKGMTPLSPEPLAISVTTNLQKLISAFEAEGDLSFIQDYYNEHLINRDRKVLLSTDNVPFPENPYTCLGIDPTGGLIVKNEQGILTTITTGEVSVRGLLGYTE